MVDWSSFVALGQLGKSFVHVDRIDSTQNYLKSTLELHAHGTLLVAQHQTRGKGRTGSAWQDSDLMASLLIKQVQLPLPWIPAALSLSLLQAGGVGYLKWPNDWLIDGAKVAGCLAEAVWSHQQLKGVVLGFGVNLVSAPQLDRPTTALLQHAQLQPSEWLQQALLRLEHNLQLPWEELRQQYAQQVRIHNVVASPTMFDQNFEIKHTAIVLDIDSNAS